MEISKTKPLGSRLYPTTEVSIANTFDAFRRKLRIPKRRSSGLVSGTVPGCPTKISDSKKSASAIRFLADSRPRHITQSDLTDWQMNDCTSPTPPRTGDGHVLRDQVYSNVRNSLMMGHYVPGQKLVIRQLASSYGTSLTPVRECLRRLVAEGVLEGEAQRSVRVPRMTGAKIRELRDIRLAVEGLAVTRAAERVTSEDLVRFRMLASEIAAARDQGDIASDVTKQGQFQLGIYRASAMPHLIRIIESLWLQTGPYLKLLFPNYISTAMERRGDWRSRLCAALEAHDAEAACREIEADVGEALDYLITLIDAAETIKS